jgi:predicted ATP-grasp superfamily ATP-dependent carboligase
MKRILDKKLLAEAAKAAGLSVLPFWDPVDLRDVAALASRLDYPILIKPRTHVHRLRNDKGILVRSAVDLMDGYQDFLACEQSSVRVESLMPDARRPFLQKFVDVTKHGVLSVTGFIDRTQKLYVTRCSAKLFQRSYPVGVGVCYVAVPPVKNLLDPIRKLCVELEYFGIFEAEFVHDNGHWAVIDFNPRLFNQIALDIHRGMPLPLLACLDAANERIALAEAVASAQTDVCEESGSTRALYDVFTLNAILLARIMTGRMSQRDHRYWREWAKERAGRAVDIAQDRSDPLPGVVHALSEIQLGLKAIPRFLRLTPRVSPGAAGSPAKVPS